MGSGNEGWEARELPDEDGGHGRIEGLGVGLSIKLLSEALRDGQRAADFRTNASPVYGPGQIAHIETNETLRLSLMLHGWTLDNEMNIPRIVSPDGTVVLTSTTGNARTGLPRSPEGKEAQTKKPRGPGARRIIRQNVQRSLEGMEVEDEKPKALIWYLLYHRVPNTDILRSELSHAVSVNDAGDLIRWQERLLLPEIDLGRDYEGPSPDRGDDIVPDVDVPVHRRAS
ncbi:MAG: hypothetical protein JWM95_4459 [Gemmatimonadetes bacterium]|nr:hypothetical protein [Gemmatimonadota bacterium]